MWSWWRQRPQDWLLSAVPVSVPSEEEYLTKYSLGTLLTTSASEQHTDLPQSLSEYSIHGVSHILRKLYTGVKEDPTSSI